MYFPSKELCDAFDQLCGWLWRRLWLPLWWRISDAWRRVGGFRSPRLVRDAAEEARIHAIWLARERQEWIGRYAELCRKQGQMLGELNTKLANYDFYWSDKTWLERKFSWLCRKEGREISSLRYLLKNQQLCVKEHLDLLEVKVLAPPRQKR